MAFGGCKQEWKSYLDSKQKHHFELESSYICIQANAFGKQGSGNAEISLSLQSSVEPNENDYFQMALLPAMMLAGSIIPTGSSELHFPPGKSGSEGLGQ